MLTQSSEKTAHALNGTTIAPFKAFGNRIQKVIHELSEQDITVDFNKDQLKTLYNQIDVVIETSVFAEMEHVMEAIRNSVKAVRAMKGVNLTSTLNDEERFNRFVAHVVSLYQSLQAQRIDILMIHNLAYQDIENHLFGEEFISEYGFKKAFDIHLAMIQSFYDCYHELLLEGQLLDTDDKIVANVIEPVIHRYEGEVLVGGETG